QPPPPRIPWVYDGNIPPQDPRRQRAYHGSTDTEAAEVDDPNAQRPTQAPETHHCTAKEKTPHRHLWWVIAPKKAYRHQGSGLEAIYTQEVGNSRKAPQRYLRRMWKQGARGNAPHTPSGRPEQTRTQGETALDANHECTQTQEHSALPEVSHGRPLQSAQVSETRKLESRVP